MHLNAKLKSLSPENRVSNLEKSNVREAASYAAMVSDFPPLTSSALLSTARRPSGNRGQQSQQPYSKPLKSSEPITRVKMAAAISEASSADGEPAATPVALTASSASKEASFFSER